MGVLHFENIGVPRFRRREVFLRLRGHGRGLRRAHGLYVSRRRKASPITGPKRGRRGFMRPLVWISARRRCSLSPRLLGGGFTSISTTVQAFELRLLGDLGILTV